MVSAGIVGGAHAFQSRNQLRDPLQGKILGLHGHNQCLRRGEHVQGEQVERRRTIQKDKIVVALTGSRLWRRRRARSSAWQARYSRQSGSSTRAAARAARSQLAESPALPGCRPAARHRRSAGYRRAGRPRPEEALACGSQSTRRTFNPSSARHAARLMAVVVLPTPPFWLTRPTILPMAFQSKGTGQTCCRLRCGKRGVAVESVMVGGAA